MPSYDRWVIRAKEEDEFNPGQRLYWSNKDGWVDKASATLFTTAEKERGHLPIGADGWEYAKEWQCSFVSATERCPKKAMAGAYYCREHRIAAGWIPKSKGAASQPVKKQMKRQKRPRLSR